VVIVSNMHFPGGSCTKLPLFLVPPLVNRRGMCYDKGNNGGAGLGAARLKKQRKNQQNTRRQPL